MNGPNPFLALEFRFLVEALVTFPPLAYFLFFLSSFLLFFGGCIRERPGDGARVRTGWGLTPSVALLRTLQKVVVNLTLEEFLNASIVT